MLQGHDVARSRLELASGSRRPMCRIRRPWTTMLPSGPARCTSRSRSRRVGTGDAAHRTREAPPSAPHSEPAPYGEHNCLLQQRPCMRFHTLPPSEMKSLYGSITRSAVSCFSYVSWAMVSHQLEPCARRFALDKLLTAVDVEGRAGNRRVCHEVDGQVGDVGRADDGLSEQSRLGRLPDAQLAMPMFASSECFVRSHVRRGVFRCLLGSPAALARHDVGGIPP